MPKIIFTQKNINKLADAMLLHPWKFIITSFFVCGFLLLQLPKLESDYGVRIWFRTTDPLIEELNALEQKFGNDEAVIVGVHADDKDGIFTPQRIKILQEITREMWMLPEVVRVDSMANFNYSTVVGDDINTSPFLMDDLLSPDILQEKRRQALKNDNIAGQFVSLDGKTAIIYGQLRPDITGSPDYRKNVQALKVMMARHEKAQGVSFHYIGASNINDAYREVSEDDIKVMMPINIIIMVLFLFTIFRTVESVLLPIGLVIITICSTFGISALFAYKFDNLSAAIPGILIATCMADCIHILATYYSLRKKGIMASEAVRETLIKNIVPTFLTSITTSIGFFTLTTTELIPVKNMTMLAGLGVMMAWFLTIFCIIPALPKLPYRPFLKGDRTVFSLERSVRYTEWLYRYRHAIFWLFSISSFFMVYVGAQNSINSDPLKHFSKRLKVQKDSQLMLDQFNGLGGPQIVVDSGSDEGIKDPVFLRKVETFINMIKSAPHVNKVTSINGIMKELNQKLHGDNPAFFAIPDTREKVAEILLLYSMGLPQGMDLNNQMTLDNRFLKLGIMWNMHDAQRSIKEVEKIYSYAKSLDLKISVTGKIVLYHRMIGYIVTTFLKSITLALILIGFTMAINLGSWRLGLLSLLPNIMPMTFGAAVMTWIGAPIDIGTSLVLSVCLGIAVDDTIHFLNHFKESIVKTNDINKTIAEIFSSTAPSLIFTTMILTLCFGVFMFADFVPNINFGILCSIILSMALIADLVYLPVIMMIFKIKK